MSLNYNIFETLKLLSLVFKYNVFYSILISVLVLNIIFIINKDKKIVKYIIISLNILLIISILYFYVDDIIKLKFSNPINNIYFYFFNTIIFLIIFSIKRKYKLYDFVFYTVSLINILFSLFMTKYLSNVEIVVIGNIFPMIKFGNIIYIIYYIVLISKLIKSKLIDKYIFLLV